MPLFLDREHLKQQHEQFSAVRSVYRAKVTELVVLEELSDDQKQKLSNLYIILDHLDESIEHITFALELVTTEDDLDREMWEARSWEEFGWTLYKLATQQNA